MEIICIISIAIIAFFFGVLAAIYYFDKVLLACTKEAITELLNSDLRKEVFKHIEHKAKKCGLTIKFTM